MIPLGEHKKDTLEISIQKKQEVEKFLFDGILKPKPNQRVFELDLVNMEVSECEYFTKSDTVNYLDVINNKVNFKERNILVKENHDYVIKLNMVNALFYFRKKWDNESIEEHEENESKRLFKNQRKVNKFRNE